MTRGNQREDREKAAAQNGGRGKTNFLRSTWCWYNPCLTPGDTNSTATMILALEN